MESSRGLVQDSSSTREALTCGLCHYKSHAHSERCHDRKYGYHRRPDPHLRVCCCTTADLGKIQRICSSPRRQADHMRIFVESSFAVDNGSRVEANGCKVASSSGRRKEGRHGVEQRLGLVLFISS